MLRSAGVVFFLCAVAEASEVVRREVAVGADAQDLHNKPKKGRNLVPDDMPTFSEPDYSKSAYTKYDAEEHERELEEREMQEKDAAKAMAREDEYNELHPSGPRRKHFPDNVAYAPEEVGMKPWAYHLPKSRFMKMAKKLKKMGRKDLLKQLLLSKSKYQHLSAEGMRKKLMKLRERATDMFIIAFKKAKSLKHDFPDLNDEDAGDELVREAAKVPIKDSTEGRIPDMDSEALAELRTELKRAYMEMNDGMTDHEILLRARESLGLTLTDSDIKDLAEGTLDEHEDLEPAKQIVHPWAKQEASDYNEYVDSVKQRAGTAYSSYPR